MKKVIAIAFFLVFGEITYGQPNMNKNQLDCDNFKFNSHMKRFIENRTAPEGDAPYVFPIDGSLKGMESIELTYILQNIDSETDGTVVFELTENWAVLHLNELLSPLVERLTNDKEVGFDEEGWIVVNERHIGADQAIIALQGIKEEDVIYTDDDIYTIAGRANFLLRRITGKDFGDVKVKTSKQELKVLRKKWVDWLQSRCISE